MKYWIAVLFLPAFFLFGCDDDLCDDGAGEPVCEVYECQACSQRAAVEYFRTANPVNGAQNDLYLFRLEDGQLVGVVNEHEITSPLREGQTVCLTTELALFCGTPPLPRNIELMQEANAEPRMALCFEDCEGVDFNESPSGECRPLATGKAPAASRLDAPQITGAPVLNGDCLEIPVGYSGCGERTEDFQLYWNGASTFSMPPQVTVELMDTFAGDELCEMYVMETLRFDLSALKEAAGESVIVKIAGTEHSVEYTN